MIFVTCNKREFTKLGDIKKLMLLEHIFHVGHPNSYLIKLLLKNKFGISIPHHSVHGLCIHILPCYIISWGNIRDKYLYEENSKPDLEIPYFCLKPCTTLLPWTRADLSFKFWVHQANFRETLEYIFKYWGELHNYIK